MKNIFTKLIILVAAILVCMITVSAIVNTYKVPDPVDYETYIVQKGDTLWKIAAKSNGYETMDPRDIIDHIQKKSEATAMIYPGQKVYVPVYDID